MEKNLIFIKSLIGVLLIMYGAKYLSNKHNIPEDALEYVGYTNCSFIKPSAKLLYYNVNLETHEKYKSTITYGHLL